jgi:hypothetical protein
MCLAGLILGTTIALPITPKALVVLRTCEAHFSFIELYEHSPEDRTRRRELLREDQKQCLGLVKVMATFVYQVLDEACGVMLLSV